MNRATRQLRHGSFKVKLSLNGNRLDLVLCYGSTGNVSCFPVVTLSWRLMDVILAAGAGKSVFWYVSIFNISSQRLIVWPVQP